MASNADARKKENYFSLIAKKILGESRGNIMVKKDTKFQHEEVKEAVHNKNVILHQPIARVRKHELNIRK